jgi:hypothetical protein
MYHHHSPASDEDPSYGFGDNFTTALDLNSNMIQTS